jgi:hypothetical protein
MDMNKKLFAVLAAAALVVTLGAGCGGKKEPENQNQGNTSANTPGDENKSGGIFSSIKDAFDRSVSLRCEYVDENGEVSINYIKNKMIRTEAAETKEGATKVYALFRDDKMYAWDDKSGNGMVLNIAGMKEDPATVGNAEVRSTDDIISVLEGKKDKCWAESVPDSYFEVPGNIKFQTWDIPNQQ